MHLHMEVITSLRHLIFSRRWRRNRCSFSQTSLKSQGFLCENLRSIHISLHLGLVSLLEEIIYMLLQQILVAKPPIEKVYLLPKLDPADFFFFFRELVAFEDLSYLFNVLRRDFAHYGFVFFELFEQFDVIVDG